MQVFVTPTASAFAIQGSTANFVNSSTARTIVPRTALATARRAIATVRRITSDPIAATIVTTRPAALMENVIRTDSASANLLGLGR